MVKRGVKGKKLGVIVEDSKGIKSGAAKGTEKKHEKITTVLEEPVKIAGQQKVKDMLSTSVEVRHGPASKKNFRDERELKRHIAEKFEVSRIEGCEAQKIRRGSHL